ncbi:hypothetical protein [Govanella unica]|uniref:Antifreeze glycopeptide polyprotein n=1 Tax=Govanella unica TaxID=2975056 RepID=A0A9X3Z5Y0_9PROT|nr:hypothetical protein [Govania unica]MDA5192364.1 hypothetical protein [Govania unica]
MICSRTDSLWLRRVCGLTAGALMLAAVSARAQDLPPEDSPPEESLPAEAAPAEVPAEDMSQPPKSVEVDALGGLRLGGMGLMDSTEGKLPVTLWQNSEVGAVTARLLAVPDQVPSRALQELERRLLLTAVPPPATPDDQADLDFVSARLDRLAATGDVASVAAFLDRIGKDFQHEGLSQLRIQVDLLTGREQDACSAAAATHGDDVEPEWLRLAAFCRALGGDLDGAGLALEMLADQKAKSPAFDQLIAIYLKQQASGDAEDKPGPQVKSLKGPTPLVLALARRTRIKLPADVLSGAPPLVFGALADMEDLDIAVRLPAAEWAAARGGYGLDRLAELYAAMPLKSGDLANAAARAKAEPGRSTYINALIYQAAAAAASTEARLAVLRAGYARARADGSRMLYAAVMAPFLDQITPDGAHVAAAGDALRMLLLAGHMEVAEEWYGLLGRQAAIDNHEATEQVTALWPLLMVWAPRPDDNLRQPGASSVSYSADYLRDWIAGREGLPPEQRARQITLVTLLLTRAGFAVPADLASSEGIEGAGFDLAIISREGRMGETILECLKLTGGGLSKLAPDAVVTISDALRAVGLDRDARRVVTETLIIQGL